MKISLAFVYYGFLINLCVTNSLDLEFRKKWIRKHFDLNKFNGTWFEAGRHGVVIDSDPGCPSWLFSVKPGGTEMDVQYHTTSVGKRHLLSYTGTLKLKTGISLRPGRPMYEMDLIPSKKEYWLFNSEVHVDVAVIDTDYDYYAFLHVVERPTVTNILLSGEAESIIALSKYRYYAIHFKRYWMDHFLSKIITLRYYNYLCMPKLREDPHPTYGDADEIETEQETTKLTQNQNSKKTLAQSSGREAQKSP